MSGHSHRPRILEKDGVLYVNPGSAGRRRFTLPISIGELLIDGKSIVARLAKLSAAGRRRCGSVRQGCLTARLRIRG